MKKLIKTLMIVLLILPMALNAQTPVYQLPNPGFENWDGNSADDEPTNWNGFPSAQCALSGLAAAGCNLATTTRHEKSTDKHSGNYSCKIFATEINSTILGIHTTANGNITTGQIYISSSTPDEATANYNVTKRSDANLSQAFNGKPDSISFWTKFTCPSTTQYARMSCILHDDYDMQDPYTTDEQQTHIVGEAVKEYLPTNGWVEYKVPFDYNHTATTPAYILLTFTTNKVPGAGSENDFVWIDDITMIYHAELSDLTSGGVTVPGFSANVLDYNIELAFGDTLPVVSYTTLSPNATATVTQPTAENPTATVVVTHGDQTKTYTVTINYVEGINEQAVRSFTLYPNPTSGQVTIALDENIEANEAVIYNMAGQSVMAQPISGNQLEMNLNSLQSGIYFVALRNGSKLVGIQKVVKE